MPCTLIRVKDLASGIVNKKKMFDGAIGPHRLTSIVLVTAEYIPRG